MAWNTNEWNFFRTVSENCPSLRDRIRVTRNNLLYTSTTVGSAFYIEFTNYNADPGQFEIITDEEDPLVGDAISFGKETI